MTPTLSIEDLSQVAIFPKPEIKDQGLYDRVKAKIQERYDFVGTLDKTIDSLSAIEARQVEYEAMRQTVAIERERARKALHIPERLGDQEVVVLQVSGSQVFYPTKHTGFLAELAFSFPVYEVMLTTKQRRTMLAHQGGETALPDGGEVHGDWKVGYVELHLTGDQVRGKGASSLAHEPVVVVAISQQDIIVRPPS